MKTHRAYKFRMKPNVKQEIAMAEVAGCRRFVYNRCVALVQRYLRHFDKYEGCAKIRKETKDEDEVKRLCKVRGIEYFADCPKPSWKLFTSKSLNMPPKSLGNRLKRWRAKYEFLQGGAYASQQDAMVAYSLAWQRVFSLKSGTPKFQSRYKVCRFRDIKKSSIKILDDKVKVPNVGYVKFIDHREIVGKPLSLTFSRTGGKWYVSVTCEVELEVKTPKSSDVVGVDVGCVTTCVASDGRTWDNHPSLAGLDEKIKHHQRKLATLTRGSSRFKKRKATIQKLQSKKANCRDYLSHQISRDLAASNATVAIEKLDLKKMTASASGTVENPGKGVAAKSNLNRRMLDQSIGKTFTNLKYKVEEYAGQVIEVDPAYTSQTCNECGHVSVSNRKTQSNFACESCGHTANADLNAAKNIRDIGSRQQTITAEISQNPAVEAVRLPTFGVEDSNELETTTALAS